MTDMDFDSVYAYSWIITGIAFAVGLAYIINDRKTGKKFGFSAPTEELEAAAEVEGVLGALSMLTPIIPPVLVVWVKVPVIPARVIGVL